MTTKTCPNCGKPLRPGARFCGNCGATIPEETSAPSASQNTGAGMFPCPNCGKPVRAGAKFCNHCGIEIQQETAQPLQPATQRTHPSSKPFKSEIATTGAVSPATAARATPGPGAPARRKKRSILPWLVAGLMAFCIIGGVGSYLYFRDPFAWQATATTGAVALSPSESPKIEVTMTVELQVTPTVEVLIPSPSSGPLQANPTIQPLSTGTSIPPVLPVPMTTITNSVVLTPELAVATPNVSILLEDDFSGSLATNWKSWGDPRATIRKGFGDSWLDLKAAEKPGQAGVTSRLELENSPGNSLELEAQLNSSYPQYALLLDWDPLQFDRGPNNVEPTIVHLEIQKNMTILRTPAANNTCQTPLDGTTKHAFLIKFVADKIVELFLDGFEEPACHLDMGIKPVPGRLSFTGTGWVTSIKIIGSGIQ